MQSFNDISNVAVVLINLFIIMVNAVTQFFKSKNTIKKVLNESLEDKLNEKLRGLYDDNRRQYRFQIVDFAGDLHNGIHKTREEFQAIFEIFDRYESLVERLNIKNHYVDSEMNYINEQYKKMK